MKTILFILLSCLIVSTDGYSMECPDREFPGYCPVPPVPDNREFYLRERERIFQENEASLRRLEAEIQRQSEQERQDVELSNQRAEERYRHTQNRKEQEARNLENKLLRQYESEQKKKSDDFQRECQRTSWKLQEIERQKQLEAERQRIVAEQARIRQEIAEEAERIKAENRRLYEARHNKLLESLQAQSNEYQKDVEERFRQWKSEREVSRQAAVVDETVTNKNFCNELKTLRSGLLEGYKRINAGAVVRLSKNTMGWFSSTENRQTVIQGMFELQDLGERFGSASFEHLNSPETGKDLSKVFLSESLVALHEAASKTDTPEFDEHFETFQTLKSAAMSVLDFTTRFAPGVSVGRDIYEAFSGKDAFSGEELSDGERVFSLLSAASGGMASTVVRAVKGFGRLSRLSLASAKFPGAASKVRALEAMIDTARQLGVSEADLNRVLNNANHIFASHKVGGHKLTEFLERFSGDQVRAFKSLEEAAQSLASRGEIQDIFNTIVNIGEASITIRGRVVDGIAKLSTAFIP